MIRSEGRGPTTRLSSHATGRALAGLLVLFLMQALLPVSARAQPQGEAVEATPLARRSWLCEPVPAGCPCPPSCLPDPLLRIPCFDACVEKLKEAKSTQCLRLGVGAYNWWNLNSESGDFTYGYPGGEGTYFYYVNGDFECATGSCAVPTVGFHAQVRFRDDTNFRSWFSGPVWLYEGYVYVETARLGTFKAGAIWKRFGLDWDGTFWGNTPYYDGWKLDTDWGFSWEQTWNEGRRFEVPSFVQLFLQENRVNGSIAGADPESTDLYEEGPTAVVRVVPTWHVHENCSLALGLSGILGAIEAEPDAPTDDETLTGYAVDLTWHWCGLEAFGEYGQTWGTQNPAHYVTGGPSDAYANLLLGFKYTYGPLTGRLSWSHGEYENPGGHQTLLVAGLDATLTNWLTLTVEYVDWEVDPDAGASVTYEDGWQFVLHWDL